MRAIGLEPTFNSGSAWIEKEDGQNEYLMCQLKSTDAQSIRINKKDIYTLENNAIISHKVPIFVIQFLDTNELFVLSRITDIPEIAKFLECGACDVAKEAIYSCVSIADAVPKKVISSGAGSRASFYEEKEKERAKTCRKK